MKSQTCETSQPLMHVNGIQINKQGFLVILQSFHHALYFFSINVMLQPLH
jgi:hypothetical protein